MTLSNKTIFSFEMVLNNQPKTLIQNELCDLVWAFTVNENGRNEKEAMALGGIHYLGFGDSLLFLILNGAVRSSSILLGVP